MTTLTGTLESVLFNPTLSKHNLNQFHQTLEQTCERRIMDAFLAGHPYWCVCAHEKALRILLYRTWKRGRTLKQDQAGLQFALQRLAETFRPVDGPQITPESAERIMWALDECCNFSQKVLSPQPMLILLPDCGHREFDAFCRPYTLGDGSVACDILMPRIWRNKTVSPESMLLHELGHALNLRLTGDLTIVPQPFLDFVEPCFPGIGTKYR